MGRDDGMATPEPAREDIFLPGGQVCLGCVSEPTLQVLREALRLLHRPQARSRQ